MSAHIDWEAIENAFVMAYDQERQIGIALRVAFALFLSERGALQLARAAKPKAKAPTLAKYRVAMQLRPLVAAFAQARGIALKEITGGGQNPAIVPWRDELSWCLRQQDPARHSYPVIGCVLGGRHHATVIKACRRFEARLATDPALRARLATEGFPIAEASDGGASIPGVDRCQGSETALVVLDDQCRPPRWSHGDDGLAAGGRSASPAKRSLARSA